jgi:8-oxo-dGTP diphosphatase
MPDDRPVFGTCDPATSYVPRPSAYAIVRRASGEVAIVRAPKGYYLPGGGLEPGEVYEDAVLREAREEVGFVLDRLTMVGETLEYVDSVEDRCSYEKVSRYFTANLIGHLAPTEADHALEWVAVEKAAELLLPSHAWAVVRCGVIPTERA